MIQRIVRHRSAPFVLLSFTLAAGMVSGVARSAADEPKAGPARLAPADPAPPAGGFVELPRAELEDRIQGGVLGQILGNLNGLPHEFKYLDEPGDVPSYTPALPQGARTDDDTDIEWLYIIEMQRSRQLYISPARITELWKAHINDWMWSANLYSRYLMDVGFDPPLTGNAVLNPWAEMNVAGLYMTEMFSLASPGLSESGAKLCCYYAHNSVDREPIQSAQFFSAILTQAFFERDVLKLIESARAALDPQSDMATVVEFTLNQWKANPQDWRATRRAIRDRYTRYGGLRPDMNGYALNSGAAVAALLYGKGDFVETLRLGFSLGWDADNTSAVCGAIMGVIHGRKWIDAQGWDIKDQYRNTSRPGLPTDETMTSYGKRVIEIALRIVKEAGGEVVTRDGTEIVRIPRQAPKNIESLPTYEQRVAELREQFLPTLERHLRTGSPVERAEATLLALRLGEWERLMKEYPNQWADGIKAIERYAPGLVVQYLKAPKPHGDAMRKAAAAAGLAQPRE
jgi:ADP-ribosylglycohydrolase